MHFYYFSLKLKEQKSAEMKERETAEGLDLEQPRAVPGLYAVKLATSP